MYVVKILTIIFIQSNSHLKLLKKVFFGYKTTKRWNEKKVMENIAFMVKKNLNLNNCLAKKKMDDYGKKIPLYVFS